MISISLGTLFKSKIVLIGCETHVDDNIWLMLLEDSVDFEEGVIFCFKRIWVDDDANAVDRRWEERGNFPGWVGFDVEELLGMLVFWGWSGGGVEYTEAGYQDGGFVSVCFCHVDLTSDISCSVSQIRIACFYEKS